MRAATLMLCSEGSMGSGIVYFLEDLRCRVSPRSTLGKELTCRFCHVSLCPSEEVNMSARLTRSPKITRCLMWLLTSAWIG